MVKRLLAVGLNNVLLDELRIQGYEVASAQHHNVIGLVENLRPDVLLLENPSDRESIIELIEQVRSSLHIPYIPIIVMSEPSSVAAVVAMLGFGADDFMSIPYNQEELFARIKAHLRRSQSERGINPITCLPGNLAIEEELKGVVASGAPFVVLYMDVDNFKSFNDTYGFLQGDEVIRMLGQSIRLAVQHRGNTHDFIGHVGGDDFVVCTTPENYDAICQDIINDFDERIPKFYSVEHRKQGYVSALSRDGRLLRHNLVSLSIAAITNEHRDIETHWEIGEIAAELKGFCKSIEHSIYVVDQRGGRDEPLDKNERQSFFHLAPAVIMLTHEATARAVRLAFKRAGMIAHTVLNSQEFFSTIKEVGPTAAVFDADVWDMPEGAIEQCREQGVVYCATIASEQHNIHEGVLDQVFQKPLKISKLVRAIRNFYTQGQL